MLSLIGTRPISSLPRDAADRINLGPRQRSPAADGETADRNRSDLHAHELEDARAERFNHPANLPIAPFRQRDLDVRVLR